MELTLESAFSSEGLLGHVAYIVLVTSMMMRTLLWLRLLVIVAALLGIAYASIILHDPVSTFWESCLVAVNIFQILRTHWRSLRARFTEAEAGLVARHLPGLSKGDARVLIDAGQWALLQDGDILTVEGQAVTYLNYIAEGRAEVLHDGIVVAICTPGSFVGEVTVATAGAATATVRVAGPATVWRVEAQTLRALLARTDDIATELNAAFARNYRDKLVQMNALVAQGIVPG